MKSINRCKCVLIGDAAVGKTAIVKSLIGKPHQTFPGNYNMTTGVDIFRTSTRQPNSENMLEFFIYDFSGKEIYADLVRKIWSNNVSVIVGVFDVTSEESFFHLQSNMTDLLKEITRPEEVVGILLGNKNDLDHRRVVTPEDAHQLAKKYKMRYFDVSAKENSSLIREAFQHVTAVWMDQRHIGSYSSSSSSGNQNQSNININNKQSNKQHRRRLSKAGSTEDSVAG